MHYQIEQIIYSIPIASQAIAAKIQNIINSTCQELMAKIQEMFLISNSSAKKSIKSYKYPIGNNIIQNNRKAILFFPVKNSYQIFDYLNKQQPQIIAKAIIFMIIQ
ncbi:hypothetical protein ABPG72_004372 [Tetrahymena utriculariae]